MINNDVKFKESTNYLQLENSSTNSAPLLPDVNEKIKFDRTFSVDRWHARAITYLDQLDEKLEQAIPTNDLQKRIDRIGSYIEEKFAPFTQFSNWLDASELGTWSQQLALFLAKLPFKAVRNIVRMLYAIVRETLFAAVHPLKAVNRLAKLLLNLIEALTRPETWSKIGAGMMGASIGQGLVTGNPFSVIGIGIGAAMLVGGVTLGALQTALREKEGFKMHAVAQHLLSEAKQIPESMLTGFCMGLIMGGIQRAIYARQMQTQGVADDETAKSYADQLVKKHGLPEYRKVELDPTGKIKIIWSGPQPRLLEDDIFHPYPPVHGEHSFGRLGQGVEWELLPNSSKGTIHVIEWDGGAKLSFEKYSYPLKNFGIEGRAYPLPPENTTLSKLGSLIGLTELFRPNKYDK